MPRRRIRNKANRRRNPTGARRSTALAAPMETSFQEMALNTRTYRDAVPLPIARDRRITINRTAGFGTVIGSTASSVFGLVQPTIAPFDPNGEFTAMFQLYRILQVTVHFIPVVARFVHELTGGTAANPGLLHSVIEYGDLGVMSAVTDAYEYSSHKETNLQTMSRTFSPRISVRGYGGLTDAFVQQRSPWMDTTYNDMVHYGVRWAQEQMVGIPNNTVLYDVRVDAVISLRSTR